MLTALRIPGVRRLGAAGLLSETGDWMLLIALPVYVLQLTGSAFTTATVLVLELVPTVLAGPFVGLLVDRCERWRLMSLVAAAQALLLLPLLAVEDAGDLWVVYLVVVAQSLLGTVIEPARAVAAAAIVRPDQLMAVNGALGLLSALARLVGGPVGGLLLGLGGIGTVVLADAISFLACAVLCAWGRPQSLPSRAPGAAPRLLHDWAAGMAVLLRGRPLRRTLAVTACLGAAQGGFLVLFVLFVLRDLQGSEADVGVLRGVQAIGSLAGGVLLGVMSRRLRPTTLLAISLGLFGVLSLAIWNAPALTTTLGLYVGLFIAVGVPGLAATTSLLTLVQLHADEAARGRVISTVLAVSGGAQAGGMLLAGLAGTGAGLTGALQVQGCLHLVAALLALRIGQPTRVPAAAPH
jgi:MFS family permease